MKRRMTLLCICLMIGVSQIVRAQSTDYSYLNIITQGSSQSFALATLQKLTFNDGSMQVVSDEGTTSFSLNSLEKLYCAATSTGIEDNQVRKVYFNSLSGCLHLDSDEIKTIQIFNAQGHMVKSSISGDRVISLINLPQGIYLIKVDNQILKILK